MSKNLRELILPLHFQSTKFQVGIGILTQERERQMNNILQFLVEEDILSHPLREAEFNFYREAPRNRPGPKRKTKLNLKEDFQEYKLHLFSKASIVGAE